MAIFEWRKLNFFELKKDSSDNVSNTLQEAEITAATNGNEIIVLCDSNCMVHIFKRNWAATSFTGHDTPVLFCKISRQNNLLVTLGNEDTGPSFKVWNLKKTNETGTPQCLRTVKTAVQKPSALGVSDGGQYMAIGFERGNISLYRGDIARDKSKTLKTLTAGTSAISGIEFKYTDKINQMFVCSDSGVYLYTLHSRDKETRVLLDTTAAPTRCCALQYGQKEGYFMIGRDIAVYCYTSDGRGPCYALESEKVLIQWFRTHLMAISKTKNIVSATQKNNILTVIDIENKFIVFSSPIDNVVAILIEWGTCFIITADKTVYHLDEKDLQSKLNILFKKNLYDIAVSVAKSSKYGADGLADIFKQYGDHLYTKGDFSRSVEQYIKTIGYLEPSYVIRRFLDSRHIHHLTDYLQAVHEKGQATADHTTLLLNCFTRLDRTEQLREFVENERDKKSIFDVDVAIKVCRSACLELALELAKKHHKHDSCLSILTEDLNANKQALQYISNLSFEDAEKSLKKFGKVLMDNCPEETIELLKKLCTDYVSNHPEELTDDLLDTSSQVYRGNPEDFMHLFINKPKLLINFLEHLTLNISNSSQLVYDTLIEQYLDIWQTDKTAEGRLLDLIRNYSESYDKNHVVILCRMYEFWPGTLYLLEEDKMYHLVVRHHLQTGDYNSLLSCCKRLGQTEPGLWLQTLAGLRNDVNVPPHLLSQVLQVIVQEKLQSPLQVLNCLAVENGPKLASVRDYFLQIFQKESEITKQEEKFTEQFRTDSIKFRGLIKNIQEKPMEFRGTVCTTCCQPLNLPALHFLCQHSYHQDCVRGYSDTEKDCPVCHKNNMRLCETLRAQSEARGQHEQFHNILNRSPEPFSVVSEHFGRGLFNKIMIVDDLTSDDQATSEEQIAVSRTRKPPPAKTPTNQSQAYGPGAEAKMRLQEGNKGKNEPLRAPMSEGRIRLEERKPVNRDTYKSSLQANLSWDTLPNKTASSSVNVPSKPSPKISANLSNSTKKTTAAAANPFDEDDETNTDYDKTKNPFAEEGDDSEGSNKINYDDRLNPFA